MAISSPIPVENCFSLSIKPFSKSNEDLINLFIFKWLAISLKALFFVFAFKFKIIAFSFINLFILFSFYKFSCFVFLNKTFILFAFAIFITEAVPEPLAFAKLIASS